MPGDSQSVDTPIQWVFKSIPLSQCQTVFDTGTTWMHTLSYNTIKGYTQKHSCFSPSAGYR